MLLFNPLTAAYALPALITFLVLRFIINKNRTGLKDIPGPSLAGYTRLWRFIDVARGHSQQTAIELHKKHGPLVRVGPGHISVGDGEEIATIYGVNSGFSKTAFYSVQQIVLDKRSIPNIFSTADERYHASKRRQIAGFFSPSNILVKEPAIDACTTTLMEKLDGFASQGTPFDLRTWMQYYIFDSISELTFSRRWGFIQQGKDVDGILTGNRIVITYMAIVGQIPWLHQFLLGSPLLPQLIPAFERLNTIVAYTLDAMEERKNAKDSELRASTTKGDLMSRLDAARLANPSSISTTDLVMHTTTNVFAGTDTTVGALSSCFYHLMKNPSKMVKLVAEIDRAHQVGRLSDIIQYREAHDHLPYLTAVLKEAMRMHPSIGLMLERHVPAGGATISGKHIPGGTIVGINPWVVARDASVYPEPDNFMPERWIDSTNEQLKLMERNFFVFGSGSRTCLGQHIAMIEMSKIIPQLLREYEFSLEHPEKAWKLRNSWMMFQDGLVCKLKKRR